MDYIEVEEAIPRPGLRLVLTAGVPGPWGEAAKAIFQLKSIDYTPVRQLGGMPNPALKRWTGQDNAPIALLDDERPRSHWADILALAERLAPQPALVPRRIDERIEMFGLAQEICGEGGFGWQRRLMMLHPVLAAGSPQGPMAGTMQNLGAKYGYSKAAGEAAPARVAEILAALAARLEAQRARGSRWLVGDELTAVDLYWAAFAALLDPLPHEVCPMPALLRSVYTLPADALPEPVAPSLLAHRDRIYREHLGLPLDF